jgi:hypothetical protein
MISLRSFGFLAPKHFKIIWLSKILALSIYNEGYFRNEQCALNVTYTLLLYNFGDINGTNSPAAGILIHQALIVQQQEYRSIRHKYSGSRGIDPVIQTLPSGNNSPAAGISIHQALMLLNY